jgi:Flp pilus assembly pilin Flp
MINQFIKDESGQDLIEYSLMLVLIAAAALIVLTTLGQSIAGIFTKTSERITSAANTVS